MLFFAKFPSKTNTQRQVKNAHCTFLPNPKNAKNIAMTTQNVKIASKSMSINKKHKQMKKETQSQRETDLRLMLVPTTLAVMGILSSCPE